MWFYVLLRTLNWKSKFYGCFKTNVDIGWCSLAPGRRTIMMYRLKENCSFGALKCNKCPWAYLNWTRFSCFKAPGYWDTSNKINLTSQISLQASQSVPQTTVSILTPWIRIKKSSENKWKRGVIGTCFSIQSCFLIPQNRKKGSIRSE